MKVGDRKKTRQLLHQMSPQLQFFGIKDIVQPNRRLDLESETMPFEDLSSLVDDILINLHLALKDVILNESTDGTNYNLIPGAPNTFTQVTAGLSAPEVFDFTALEASFIRIEVLNNYGDMFTVFGEVTFSGIEVILQIDDKNFSNAFIQILL
ncbi:hypothetical protein [Patiriisocius sp. Uisw_047]|uniref:hypothetical protein n=1 Tax=Patiriisocius sp. Uisw_047 TaxID=3230969 RepID=UPI0039E7C72C